MKHYSYSYSYLVLLCVSFYLPLRSMEMWVYRRTFECNEILGKQGWTQLDQAVLAGDIKEVEQLIAAGANVNAQDRHGWTPLHRSAHKGNARIMKMLIAAGAMVDVPTFNGSTPLHEAVWREHEDAVKLLLEAKADVSASGADNISALHYAADKGHNKIVAMLIAAGADVHAKKKGGATPLHVAAEAGHITVIKQLCAAGANTEEKDERGRTVLHGAALYGERAAVAYLIGLGVRKDLPDTIFGHTPLLLAASMGYSEVIKIFLENEVFADTRSSDGSTALHAASLSGKTDVVSQLLKAGADVNIQDVEGDTPLHGAANYNHIETAKVLLEAGANVQRKNKYSKCPLIGPALVDSFADRKGMIELLIAWGADKNIVRDISEMKSFVKNSGSINEKNVYGRTMLHEAVLKGKSHIVHFLLYLRADVDIRDNEKNETPLQLAVRKGDSELVGLFIAEGINRNVLKTKQDVSLALPLAAQAGHYAIVKQLLDAGADVNTRDSEGKTALHEASGSGHGEVVYLLLAAAADIHAKSLTGQTALTCAQLKGHRTIICDLELAIRELDARVQGRLQAIEELAISARHSKGFESCILDILKENQRYWLSPFSKIMTYMLNDTKHANRLHKRVGIIIQKLSPKIDVLEESQIPLFIQFFERHEKLRNLEEVKNILRLLQQKNEENLLATLRSLVKGILSQDQSVWLRSLSALIKKDVDSRLFALAEKKLEIIAQELFPLLAELKVETVEDFIFFFQPAPEIKASGKVKEVLEILRLRSLIKGILSQDQSVWLCSLTALIKKDLDCNRFALVAKKLEIIARELFPHLDELTSGTRIDGFIFFFQPDRAIKAIGKVSEVLDILKARKQKVQPSHEVQPGNKDVATLLKKRSASVSSHHSDSEEDEPVDWDDLKPIAPRGSRSSSVASSSSVDPLSDSSQLSNQGSSQTPPPVPVRDDNNAPRVKPQAPPRSVSLTNLKAKALAFFSKPKGKTIAKRAGHQN